VGNSFGRKKRTERPSNFHFFFWPSIPLLTDWEAEGGTGETGDTQVDRIVKDSINKIVKKLKEKARAPFCFVEIRNSRQKNRFTYDHSTHTSLIIYNIYIYLHHICLKKKPNDTQLGSGRG